MLFSLLASLKVQLQPRLPVSVPVPLRAGEQGNRFVKGREDFSKQKMFFKAAFVMKSSWTVPDVEPKQEVCSLSKWFLIYCYCYYECDTRVLTQLIFKSSSVLSIGDMKRAGKIIRASWRAAASPPSKVNSGFKQLIRPSLTSLQTVSLNHQSSF